ncbi:MAG: methylated-DNA--[protein]-cysteine S-methyltransferase [Oscillospiraceae bacterium]|nr:methylated-DNA--[protein]-cysteine S-methyltransferase [Oscillospiraceae bacterium]
MGGRIIVDTPVGYLEIISDGTALTGIRSVGGITGEIFTDEITAEAKRQLAEYFNKKRRRFELPLHLNGTDFQLRVWNALAEIPFGGTRSYKDIAEAAGSPKACRAVGNAVGKNPFLIVLPCHRIIASDDTIGGFSADIRIKKYLLEFEKG